MNEWTSSFLNRMLVFLDGARFIPDDCNQNAKHTKLFSKIGADLIGWGKWKRCQSVTNRIPECIYYTQSNTMCSIHLVAFKGRKMGLKRCCHSAFCQSCSKQDMIVGILLCHIYVIAPARHSASHVLWHDTRLTVLNGPGSIAMFRWSPYCKPIELYQKILANCKLQVLYLLHSYLFKSLYCTVAIWWQKWVNGIGPLQYGFNCWRKLPITAHCLIWNTVSVGDTSTIIWI